METQCSQIQNEIDRFIESYIAAVEEHRSKLLQQVNEAKEERLKDIEKHKKEVLKRLNDTNDVVVFVDELLSEGTDVEILSFVKPILKRLEVCGKKERIPDIKVIFSSIFKRVASSKVSLDVFSRVYFYFWCSRCLTAFSFYRKK